MAIGTDKPAQAKNRCWKDCIAVALDEVTTALEECFCDLTDEQVWSRPIAGRHSIGTMVMHCLGSLNGFACYCQTGRHVEDLKDEDRFDVWSHGPAELDERQKPCDLPAVARMAEWVRQVRKIGLEGLAAATEDDLRGERIGSDWCKRSGRPAGDAYLRTIFHVMAHVRQVWCLRGAMGAYGEAAWPRQHYA